MTAADLPSTPEPTCYACDAPLIAPFRFCGACGSEQDDRCVRCGHEMEAGDTVCAACNAPPLRADGTPAPVGRNTWDVLLKRLRKGLHGEFRVTKELGRGGQAAVYLASELALRRQVAIKVLARSSYVDDAAVARFQDEARTIAGFRHPHIVTVYSIRKLGALPLFIMQYLEGRSLAAVLRADGPLPWALARAVLYQVGTALEYAHQRQVVHRDIKPANIIFDGEGNAVVTDFGIAKKVNEIVNASTTGMLVGTPAYMSPEQCHGESVTPASDQYGLGVVAYELITGRVPFQGTELAVMHGHAEGAVPPLREFAPECPKTLESAVLRMLAKAPGRRFPSLHAALDALGAQPLSDDDPVRHAIQNLALQEGRDRGRSLNETFGGFGASSDRHYTLNLPARLRVNQRAECTVVLTNGEVSDAQGNAREFPVDLPVAWSVTPPERAHIDVSGGQLTAKQPGPLTVRAIVAGHVLTGPCIVDATVPLLSSRPSGSRRSRARMYGAAGVVIVGLAGGAFATRQPDRPTGTDVVGDTMKRGPTPELPSGTIEGLPSRLAVGEGGQASPAWGAPRAGASQPAPAVRWTTSDPSKLRVNARTGEYVAVGSGSTVVAFDLDGRRVASLAVTVLRVKRVTYIFGNNSFLNVGESRRVTVQLIDGQGNAVDPDEVLVRYRAEPTSVLRVDELGQVTGISTGKGIVTITAGGAQVKVAVQVESPGAS